MNLTSISSISFDSCSKLLLALPAESYIMKVHTPIYRYHMPLRILFWLNNRDPFRGVKKRQSNDFHLNLRKRSIKIEQKHF